MKYDITELSQNLLTAIQWNYGKVGAGASSLFAAAASAITMFFGGWDSPLQLLLGCMIFDFVFGLLASIKAKTTDSQIMFWGGVNKAMVLALVGLGALLDSSLGMSAPYVRTLVIWFYVGREGLSIFENLGKLGMPYPEALKSVFAQLSKKGESHESNR